MCTQLSHSTILWHFLPNDPKNECTYVCMTSLFRQISKSVSVRMFEDYFSPTNDNHIDVLGQSKDLVVSELDSLKLKMVYVTKILLTKTHLFLGLRIKEALSGTSGFIWLYWPIFTWVAWDFTLKVLVLNLMNVQSPRFHPAIRYGSGWCVSDR